MLRFAIDKSAAIFVVAASGNSADEDIVSFRQALLELDEHAAAVQMVPATIFVVAADAERPSAAQRQQFAELWSLMQAPLHLFALVSTSAVDRGIMKVISWINPPGQRRRESVHATFEQAAAWTTRERGRPIPELSTLRAQLLGSQG